MTSNILLVHNGRILAEGQRPPDPGPHRRAPAHRLHQGRGPRALARRFLADDNMLSLKFDPGALIIQTAKPDVFYARLTELAASGEAGQVEEVTSPDDNLQAVFQYLVK
jgi:ABC-2 type transport system ATP-binding protein